MIVFGSFFAVHSFRTNDFSYEKLIAFSTIIFVVITLGALLAHLFALPHKINLTKEDYKTVQAIYRGWAWLGIFEIGAIVFTLVWTIVEKKNKNIFRLLLAALLIFLVSITIFFAFTFPANKETLNWTVLPQNWESIRTELGIFACCKSRIKSYWIYFFNYCYIEETKSQMATLNM